MLEDSGDEEDCAGGEYLSLSYGFLLCFLSLSIGFGMKNHQASTPIPIVQPAIMTQLQSPAIEKFSQPVSIPQLPIGDDYLNTEISALSRRFTFPFPSVAANLAAPSTMIRRLSRSRITCEKVKEAAVRSEITVSMTNHSP